MKKRMILLLIAAMLAGKAGMAQIGSPLAPAVEAKQIEILKSDAAFKEKQTACRVLAIGGTKESVAALSPLLADEKLSHMARYALEQIRDPAAVAALREALGKVQGTPLLGVIASVGNVRDAQAVDTLTKMLNADDAAVSDAAAFALGRIGNTASSKALLARVPKATPALYDGLLRAGELLPAKESVPVYDAVLKSSAPQPLRMAALRGALMAREAQATPLLLETLRGNDDALVLAAIQAARALPGAAVSKALADELQGNKLSAERQILVAQVLGDRRDKSAAPALNSVAKKSAGDLRIAAVNSLVKIGDASSFPLLVELTTSGDAETAKAARLGLIAIPGKAVEAPIIGMLQAKDSKARIAAADLVIQRRMTGAIPALLQGANDADAAVATANIRALGEVAGTAEVPALVKVLTTGAQTQAAEAALSAMNTRTRDVAMADAVAAALPNAAPAAKLSLLRVLRRVGGPKSLAQMRLAMADSNKEISELAARSLTDWATPDALPDTMAIAKNPPSPALKVLALRGAFRLIPLQEAAPEAKLASVKDALAMVERPEEKRSALTALGTIPTADALALVVPELANDALKEEASLAAVNIGEQLAKTQPAVVSDAMKQVLPATKNQDLAKRAKALIK